MRTIIYIGNFAFPDKNASGKRVLANCLCFQKMGFRTACIGPGDGTTESQYNVTSYTIKSGSSVKRVINNDVKRIINILENEKNTNQLCAIILYGALFTQRENLKIIEWCKINLIKVIYDQVDWFELNWHNPLRAIVRWNNNRLMNKSVIPSCDGVICISKYLEKYHKNSGCKTVVIPPLSIVHSDIDISQNNKKDIIFAYAGTSTDIHRPVEQWKDRIDLFLEILSEFSTCEEVREFCINIYGFTYDQYINMFPTKLAKHAREVVETLGKRIVFHGRVANSEAVNGIKNADFTFLIRNKKRSTMAGFPTKVSESISIGTPVICNDTSDLLDYILNEKNGVILPLSEMKNGIKKILQMTNDDIACLREGCLDNPFYYENFTDRLESWIKDILL